MKNKATTIVFFLSLSCFSQTIIASIINIFDCSSQKGFSQFEWSVGEMALINEMPGNDGFSKYVEIDFLPNNKAGWGFLYIKGRLSMRNKKNPMAL